MASKRAASFVGGSRRPRSGRRPWLAALAVGPFGGASLRIGPVSGPPGRRPARSSPPAGPGLALRARPLSVAAAGSPGGSPALRPPGPRGRAGSSVVRSAPVVAGVHVVGLPLGGRVVRARADAPDHRGAGRSGLSPGFTWIRDRGRVMRRRVAEHPCSPGHRPLRAGGPEGVRRGPERSAGPRRDGRPRAQRAWPGRTPGETDLSTRRGGACGAAPLLARARSAPHSSAPEDRRLGPMRSEAPGRTGRHLRAQRAGRTTQASADPTPADEGGGLGGA